jgi:hypothetical protein
MGVGSGRSKVADLQLHVFRSVVSPDWFTVRASRRVSRTSWEADVRIIEGGHAITWGSGAFRFNEILVGCENPIPENGRMFYSGVKRERSTRLAPDPRIEYQSCFEAERLDAEVFAHLSQEILLDAAPADIFHRFTPPSRMAPAPVSRLHIEARGKGLSVQAFHTFPEERTIVRVQSLFEVVE